MLKPGEIIEGKYQIIRLLGEGGMGAVYEGENARIHRRVAIKVLHATVAAKADVVQRFEREAQAAGRIGSQHIVEVLDLGNLPTGERYMVMEFLEGESFGDRIRRRKKMTPFEAAPLVHQLLEGLEAAHRAGIIHRDLKPDNVFICAQRGSQRDFVKVLDFGVSKFSSLDNEMSMTKTGAVMGTPFYMSPEQARGAKIDLRSDLYSVGVVLYQAVTGRVPFNAETFNELVFKIALEAPEPAELVSPGLDAGFAQVIARAMVRDANGRFQTAREFQAVLTHWMSTSSSPMGTGFPAVHLPSGAGMSLSSGVASRVGPGLPSSSFDQTTPNLAQPQSQVHALGQSGAVQGGVAIPAPQKSGSGPLIAMAAVALSMLGGGAFAAYKVFGGHASPSAPAATDVPSAAEPTTGPTTAETATAQPPEPPASAPAAASATAPAEPETEPATSAAAPAPSASVARPVLKGRLPGKLPTSKTAAANEAPPRPTGRVIGSEL